MCSAPADCGAASCIKPHASLRELAAELLAARPLTVGLVACATSWILAATPRAPRPCPLAWAPVAGCVMPPDAVPPFLLGLSLSCPCCETLLARGPPGLYCTPRCVCAS